MLNFFIFHAKFSPQDWLFHDFLCVKLHYAHHGMLVKFVLFLQKYLHYNLMIFLFWHKDSMRKNISWVSREVLILHQKIIDVWSWLKKFYHTKEWRWTFLHLKKEINLVYVAFPHFCEVFVLLFSRKMIPYIFTWYEMYLKILVQRTTECWSTHHRQKHINFEKYMTVWDAMVWFLKVITVVYIWISFAWS